MSREQRVEHEGLKIGRLLLGIVVLSFIAAVWVKFFSKGDRVTRVPKEIQLSYMPADFSFQVDEDFALAVLSNPDKYRKEFSQLVYDINTAILGHVATRMGLTAVQRKQVIDNYEKQHPYILSLYYQDFLQLQDPSSQIYQTWYNNRFKSATESLFEVASKYTCGMINSAIAPVVPMKEGTLFAKGKNVSSPCAIAVNEALVPFLRKLEDRAAIQDFGLAEGLLQERVGKVISELATYEVRDKKGLSKQLKTKLLGINVSSTEVQISAISIAKIGFRLNEYFKISLDPGSKVVTVTLPQPVILSHEVYPRFDKLSIGWMREVSDADFNRAINVLREEFRRDIQQSDAYSKAKGQVREILTTMLGPVVKSFGKGFQMQVQFQAVAEEPYPGNTDGFNN